MALQRGPRSLPFPKLFQKSLYTKQVLQDWRNMNIMPVHKGGSRNNKINYQPISITSRVSKILEGNMKHLIGNKLLTASQHGLKSGCLVETNLIGAYDYVTEFLNCDTRVDMILLGFAKAFDKVYICQLRIKLTAITIYLEVVEWVMQFLIGRKQRAKVFGDNGQEFFSEVESGMPHRIILGSNIAQYFLLMMLLTKSDEHL